MKMTKPRIAVFFGGDADSQDLSEETALWLCYFLPRNRYQVTPVRINSDGMWQVPLGSLPERGPIKQMMTNLFQAVRAVLPARGLERLLQRPVSAFATVLRGRGGDDGALHGLASALNIPVIGSPLSACQRTSNKHVCGLSLADVVLPPQTRHYSKGHDVAAMLEDARTILVPPLFVKPAQQEASVGVREAVSVDELGAALAATAQHGDVVVQQRTPGHEVCITLYDDERGRVHALPTTTVIPKAARYFDHLAKRRAGRVALATSDQHDSALIKEAEEIARDVYREVGAEGLVSFDMVAGEEGIELLDVNTVPTLSRYTPLIHQLQAARINPGALFDRFIWRRLTGGPDTD